MLIRFKGVGPLTACSLLAFKPGEMLIFKYRELFNNLKLKINHIIQAHEVYD